MKYADQEFAVRAEYCAMGDLTSMFWMWEHFHSQLTEESLSLESAYLGSPSSETWNPLAEYFNARREETVRLQAANFWLCRAALYGSEEAAALLRAAPEREDLSLFDSSFQQPGKHEWRPSPGAPLIRFCGEEIYTAIGLPELNGSCHLDPLAGDGVYRGEANAGCEGPDETGFGMEEEYDFSYYDEFFRFLFVLHGWSRIDLRGRSNAAMIQERCARQRAEKAQERERFWENPPDGCVRAKKWP